MKKHILNGNDAVSIEVMKTLESTKVKDIPEKFDITLDQAKRISRFRNILLKSKENLESETYEKIKNLGFKAFILNDLVKVDDWEGVAEIINSVSPNVSQNMLKKMLSSLDEKRKRIYEFEEEIKHKKVYLKRKEESAKKEEKILKELRVKLEEKAKFLKKYPKDTKDFLMKHVGFHNDEMVLKKRVDSRWRKILLKNKIIEYDEWEYVHRILKLDELAKQYEFRTKRKYQTEWDYDLENSRSDYYIPNNPYYKNGNGLDDDLMSEIQEVEGKMNEIEEERKNIEKEMRKLRKTNPESFMESVEASNMLSEKDLKKHGELQDKALKWLYNRGYVATVEIVLDNGRRVDVIGYNEEGEIVVVEVKASIQDFKNDNKWDTYLDYCDRFYFLFDGCYEAYSHLIKDKLKAGLLDLEGKGLKILQEEQLKKHEPKSREKLIFQINRQLSKKLIYGY